MNKIKNGQAPGLDKSGNHFALIRFGGNSNPKGEALIGRQHDVTGQIHGICSKHIFLRTSANRYYDYADDLFTAMVRKFINIQDISRPLILSSFRFWSMRLDII